MSAENEVLVRYVGPGPAVLAGLFITNGESRWVTRGALDQAIGTHPAGHFEEVETRAAPAADSPPAVVTPAATMSTDMPTPPTYDAQGRMIAGVAGANAHFVAGGVDDTGASSSPAARFTEGLDYPPGRFPTGGVPAAGGPEASGGANPVRPVVVTAPSAKPEWPAVGSVAPAGATSPGSANAPTGVNPWPATTTITPAPPVNPPTSEEQANAADAAESKRQAAKRGRAAQ